MGVHERDTMKGVYRVRTPEGAVAVIADNVTHTALRGFRHPESL